MILPRTPDEALVVDVALRGLDSGSMIEQAYRILMQVPYSVGPRGPDNTCPAYRTCIGGAGGAGRSVATPKPQSRGKLEPRPRCPMTPQTKSSRVP